MRALPDLCLVAFWIAMPLLLVYAGAVIVERVRHRRFSRLIHLLADGACSPEERATITAHLPECPRCSKELEGAVQLALVGMRAGETRRERGGS